MHEYIYMYVCMYVLHAYISMHQCVYACMYIIYVCMCAYMYYIHTMYFSSWVLSGTGRIALVGRGNCPGVIVKRKMSVPPFYLIYSLCLFSSLSAFLCLITLPAPLSLPLVVSLALSRSLSLPLCVSLSICLSVYLSVCPSACIV